MGSNTLFATYPVCFWSGTLGPKLKEGDRQAPEGFYTVTFPQAYREGTRWVVGLDLGFPNSFDRVNARTGSAILIHGGCASIGCFAVTNPVNDEIDKLVLRSIGAGQAYVPIHVFPFRMTSENFNRYDVPQWRDFWRNLKIAAGLIAIAWPSSMPSAKVSLMILLLRCGSSARRTRSSLQSAQVSPPSAVLITPLTSSAA